MMQPTAPPAILLPLVALVLWTLVMLVWATIARLSDPGILKLGPNPGKRTADLAAKLSPRSQYKVDNYNHLTEQPVLFYAIVLAIVFIGAGGDRVDVALAWGYTGSRVVHSLVHATSNVVTVRLGVFLIGTVILAALAVNAARAFF